MEAGSRRGSRAMDLQTSLQSMARPSLRDDLRGPSGLSTTADLMLEVRGRRLDLRIDLNHGLRDLLGDLRASLSMDPAMLSRFFQLPT